MPTAPTYDILEKKMGTCQIEIDGTPIGGTLRDSNVIVRLPTDYEDMGYAQAGSRRTDAQIVGDDFEIVTPLAELSYVNLAKIFPGWTLVEDGDKRKIEMVSRVGLQFGRDEHHSKVVVKPIIGGYVTEDANLWLTAYKAFPMTPAAEVTFALRQQRSIEITWGTLPDATKNNSRGCWGDETATDAS